MKTKVFFGIIALFAAINSHGQTPDTLLLGKVPNCVPTLASGDTCMFQYIGDTLLISGTVYETGCGKQVAVVTQKDDSLLIKTMEIRPAGADCQIVVHACYQIKIAHATNNSIVKFNGVVYAVKQPQDTLSLDSIKFDCSSILMTGDTCLFKYLGDTLQISGKVWKQGCGKHVAVYSQKNDSLLINTMEIVPSGSVDCQSIVDACYEIKVPKASNDSIVKFDGTVYRLKSETTTTCSNIVNDAIAMYPNPTNGILHIDLKKPVTQKCVVEIYDLNGMKLLSEPLTASSNIVQTSKLQAGSYVVCIVQNNVIVARQIVIKID